MVNHGSLQHQKLINETIEELRNMGFNVINTSGVAPDAIAVKNDVLYAVEVLLVNKIPKKGWEHLTVVKNKRNRYNMFDEVIFKVSNRNIKILSGYEKKQLEMEKQAKKIVSEWLKGGIVNEVE